MPKKKRVTIPPLQVDLIPVLSCMFLLVPALLLAMEAANWASVPVSPPRFTQEALGQPSPDEPRALRVEVREDGYALSLGPCPTCAPDQVVALRGEDGLDGLREVARGIKASHPGVEQVYLSAEASISLQTLVETMDVLRGDTCSLAPDSTRAGCLFPGVVIGA
ncbi:MAG: ExbD/TolR family protein [Nannocystaceae bacterium]|nr:biopolymer transporter ExbD [bacterium]